VTAFIEENVVFSGQTSNAEAGDINRLDGAMRRVFRRLQQQTQL